MATAGKILMFPVGNWTSGNNYGFLDIVYYGGSSYVAKTDITNSTTNPATDTTNWQILAHGYIADTLSGIDGIDTSGLIGTAGAIVSSQALMDKIADMVATKLVLKTAISNQQVNDTTKVTGSALAYSMGQSIDTLNSNLGVQIRKIGGWSSVGNPISVPADGTKDFTFDLTAYGFINPPYFLLKSTGYASGVEVQSLTATAMTLRVFNSRSYVLTNSYIQAYLLEMK